MIKWIGPDLFMPPFGSFTLGDDLSNLPAETQAALVAEGLASDGTIKKPAKAVAAPVTITISDEEAAK